MTSATLTYNGQEDGIAIITDGEKRSTFWFTNRQSFIPVDRDSGAQVKGGRAMNAAVKSFKAGNGHRMMTLVEATDETEVLVLASCALPRGITPKPGMQFAARTLVRNGRVVQQSGNEMLLSLKAGAIVTIFFADGLVKKFTRKKTGIVEQPMSRQDMANERIAWCKRQVDERLADDNTARHLALLYRFGGSGVHSKVETIVVDLKRKTPSASEAMAKAFTGLIDPRKYLALLMRASGGDTGSVRIA